MAGRRRSRPAGRLVFSEDALDQVISIEIETCSELAGEAEVGGADARTRKPPVNGRGSSGIPGCYEELDQRPQQRLARRPTLCTNSKNPRNNGSRSCEIPR